MRHSIRSRRLPAHRTRNRVRPALRSIPSAQRQNSPLPIGPRRSFRANAGRGRNGQGEGILQQNFRNAYRPAFRKVLRFPGPSFREACTLLNKYYKSLLDLKKSFGPSWDDGPSGFIRPPEETDAIAYENLKRIYGDKKAGPSATNEPKPPNGASVPEPCKIQPGSAGVSPGIIQLPPPAEKPVAPRKPPPQKTDIIQVPLPRPRERADDPPDNPLASLLFTLFSRH